MCLFVVFVVSDGFAFWFGSTLADCGDVEDVKTQSVAPSCFVVSNLTRTWRCWIESCCWLMLLVLLLNVLFWIGPAVVAVIGIEFELFVELEVVAVVVVVVVIACKFVFDWFIVGSQLIKFWAVISQLFCCCCLLLVLLLLPLLLAENPLLLLLLLLNELLPETWACCCCWFAGWCCGDAVVLGLWRLMVDNRLTNDVLCLNLNVVCLCVSISPKLKSNKRWIGKNKQAKRNCFCMQCNVMIGPSRHYIA